MRKIQSQLLMFFIFLLVISKTSTSQVVISQVYGGGGNAGSVFRNDFIEIFNRGNTTQNLTGWSVQYAAAGGTTWQITNLSGSIAPGQYYLIQEAIGAGGTTNLPVPDAIGTIAMAGAAGKVVLVNSAVALSGSGCPFSASIIDFVGFGTTANCFEGTGPTPAPSNTNAVLRTGNGCTDANNNATDFTAGLANPRNTASPINICGAPVTNVSVASGANAAEPATNGTFTINLTSPAPVGGVTITYTLNGSATLNTDYTDIFTGSVTIAEGNSSATITLSPADDVSFEGTETIDITLNTATSPYAISTGNASINLLDNDAPPAVSVIAGINAAEPVTNGTFTVNLTSPAPAGGVTINYTLSGTATLNTDYSDPLSGSITIPQGSSNGTITLNVIDDPAPEAIETIIITLNSVTGTYIINTGTATINLNSNDIAPISITSGNVYSQDFNSLANTGTANSLSIQGWQINETGGGARDNELYAADNGASNTGDTYSYGTTAATERALGSLLSGTLVSSFGAYFVNNTGTTINSLKIGYTGEQWRLGTINRTDRINFQYSIDATSITAGTWTDFDQLDFSSPVTVATGAKDGNAPANRTMTLYTIHGLSIPDGAEFFIRWNDSDASGADDGLAIDDFSIEANPIDVSGPITKFLSPANGTINVPLGFTATITFDEDIQKGIGNIYLKRVADGTIAQAIDVTSSSVTVSVNNISFNITSAVYSTSYYIEIDAGAFRDVLGNNFNGISGRDSWSFTTEPPPPPGIIANTYSFNTCSGAFPDGFTQFSVTGSIAWGCTAFGRDPSDPSGQASLANGVQMNGFAGGTNVPNVDWFISPPYDLTGTTYPLLSFWSRTAFNGLPLQLKVSTDYNGGDPSVATWTDINGKFPAQTSNAWTLAENINLSAFKQSNVHFAFVYTSTDDDGARWTLDDISVINSPAPPPPSLTVSTADIQYTFVAAGSTADKTFTFTGNDITDDVTLTSTGDFLLSKDGTGFSSSVQYTLVEANNISQTVYVRFVPSQNNLNFTGNVTISTSSLTSTVNLKGTSIDPVTTLEVVNWNVEWFGSTTLGPTNDNQQEQNVKTILQNLNADVYALTEVVSETRLANVVSQMPGYAYVISNYGSHTNTSVNPPGALAEAQKLAFIYKTSVLNNITSAPLLSRGINSAADITNPAYNYWASGRFPFMMSADVTLNCVTKNVKFVLVHGKANTSPTATSYDRRKRGADSLYYTLQQNYANDNVIILGDYNDDLDQSITAGFTITSWNSFTDNAVNFTPVTLPLSLAGKKSTVSFNDVIDHVIVSNDFEPYYLTATAGILTDVTGLVSNYGSTTTDHFPVFSRYRFSNTTAPAVISCTEQTTFCANSTNIYTVPAFTATDDCGDVVTYSYAITGATVRSGSSNNASGTFNIGTSIIIWTVSDSWGNTSTCQTTVTINANPTVTIPDAFALSSGVLPNTVYVGYLPASTITLTSIAQGGTPGYSYSWSSGSTVSTATVNPIVPATYTVTVTDANNCRAIAGKTINVMDIRGGNNLDKVTICHKPNAQTNTLVINGSDVAAHLAHGDNLGGCQQQVSPQTILRRGLINEPVAAKLAVQVLPNPSATSFTINIKGAITDEAINIKVTDVLGRTIERRQHLQAGQLFNIGQNYKTGMYFVEISQGKEKTTLKLVKH